MYTLTLTSSPDMLDGTREDYQLQFLGILDAGNVLSDIISAFRLSRYDDIYHFYSIRDSGGVHYALRDHIDDKKIERAFEEKYDDVPQLIPLLGDNMTKLGLDSVKFRLRGYQF